MAKSFRRDVTHPKTYNDNGHKWCSKCLAYHPLKDFTSQEASRDGKSTVCSAISRLMELMEAGSKKLKAELLHKEAEDTFLRWKYFGHKPYIMPDAWEIYKQELNKKV